MAWLLEDSTGANYNDVGYKTAKHPEDVNTWGRGTDEELSLSDGLLWE